MDNIHLPAFPVSKDHDFVNHKDGLTKLEYALIHSNWEPSKEAIESQYRQDKMRNPHNEPNKPILRTESEIVRDLKISYLSTLLSNK